MPVPKPSLSDRPAGLRNADQCPSELADIFARAKFPPPARGKKDCAEVCEKYPKSTNRKIIYFLNNMTSKVSRCLK